MASRNDKPRLKAEQRRQLTIFFNKVHARARRTR
jgi:hypothetical protein